MYFASDIFTLLRSSSLSPSKPGLADRLRDDVE